MTKKIRNAKIGRPTVYSSNAQKQAAFRARQVARGLQLVWVSRRHLAMVMALVAVEAGVGK